MSSDEAIILYNNFRLLRPFDNGTKRGVLKIAPPGFIIINERKAKKLIPSCNLSKLSRQKLRFEIYEFLMLTPKPILAK